MSDDDHMAGLDPDERAEAERLSAAESGQPATPPARRAIIGLATFVIVFLPAVIGAIVLAEKFVYTPLCARASAAEVIDVELDLPIDAAPGTDTGDGRTTCSFANGDRIAMQEAVAKPVAIALDWALTIIAFALPFVITAIVMKVVPRPT